LRAVCLDLGDGIGHERGLCGVGGGIGLCRGQSLLRRLLGIGGLAFIYLRAFARRLEVDARGRQAALVVARTVFQIGVDGICGLGKLHLLDKLYAVLKIAQVHLEELVEVGNLMPYGLQLAHKLHAIELVHVESGRYRAVGT
jgi:hypothetical protein